MSGQGCAVIVWVYIVIVSGWLVLGVIHDSVYADSAVLSFSFFAFPVTPQLLQNSALISHLLLCKCQNYVLLFSNWLNVLFVLSVIIETVCSASVPSSVCFGILWQFHDSVVWFSVPSCIVCFRPLSARCVSEHVLCLGEPNCTPALLSLGDWALWTK